MIRQGDVLLLSGGEVTLFLPDGSQLDAATAGRLIVEHMGPSAGADGLSIVLRAEGGSFTFRPSHTPSPAVGADITILTPAAQIDPAQSAFSFATASTTVCVSGCWKTRMRHRLSSKTSSASSNCAILV
ncbi:MAG: hypothetical protein HWD60_14770 [Defluviicoccus sp.]|nr:MAG: hypothetical protein HWD60_14770 [Defluviicoccus sp.]